MQCPRDRTPLHRTDAPGGQAWSCPACTGHFVEKYQLDAILAAWTPGPPGPSAGWEKPAYLACPKCGKGTRRLNYRRVSGVLVDDCPFCGTWFDAGELDRVAGFLATGGAARGAAMEAQLADEKRRSDEKLERMEAKLREDERARRRRLGRL